MSIIKYNIIANFFGNVWTGFMSLVFVPIYVHFIGIEAYGLMGIFATLLAISFLLDMGVTATVKREMALLAVQEAKVREIRDLIRTLEIPYWAIGIIISIIVVLLSPFIAYRWINTENLSPKTVETAIMLMGLTLAFQWPIGFYSGGLMGLQRQVMLNIINVVISTFRGLGAVLLLWTVSPTVEVFFSWQVIVSIINVGILIYFLWRILPSDIERPHFRYELLMNIWRFSLGMSGITLLSVILSQLDKVIISRILNLEIFGYYTLASVVAMNLLRFARPISTAAYPRMTNLVSLGATKDLAILYHKSAQLVSVLVLPAAIIIALFSKEVLWIWTQNTITAENTHILVSILVMGTAVNGLLSIPYMLQLAYGQLRLPFFANLVSLLLLVPLMIIFTKWYGAIGASFVWIILNVGSMFVTLPIMHRYLLTTEKWLYYIEDVGIPFFAALLPAGVLRLIVPISANLFTMTVTIVIISGITLTTTALATQVTRDWIQKQLLVWRFSYGG